MSGIVKQVQCHLLTYGGWKLVMADQTDEPMDDSGPDAADDVDFFDSVPLVPQGKKSAPKKNVDASDSENEQDIPNPKRQAVNQTSTQSVNTMELNRNVISHENNNIQKTREENSLQLNNAMRSHSSLNTVVIIKILNEEGKIAFSKPALFCQYFEKSLFAKTKVKEVRTNKRKHVFVVEFQEKPDENLLQEILDIKLLGDWKIECYIPNRGRYTYGVIHPVDIETDLTALKAKITCENASIVKLERLMKRQENKNVIPSESVRVIFDTQNLPSTIKVGYISYTVRPYVFQPLQCYNCQMIGHTAPGCTRKQKCLFCSGEHPVRECKSKDKHCANCKESHSANSTQCRLIKQAKQLERINAYRNVQSNTAQNRFKDTGLRDEQIQSYQERRLPEPQRYWQQPGKGHMQSYRDVAILGMQETSTTTQRAVETRTIGVQTGDESKENGNALNMHMILEELKKFIVDLVDEKVSKLRNDLIENRQQIVKDIIGKAVGKQMDHDNNNSKVATGQGREIEDMHSEVATEDVISSDNEAVNLRKMTASQENLRSRKRKKKQKLSK